ncbi:MAG: tungstate ABC transporter substrate-binding protein WtpA, partial [Candidatus Thermoplasmatota archaeon]|nr:tungstate ABC transporter substrate-binding protein WtpA [Candidatus Thermoplasmatota archaeon]
MHIGKKVSWNVIIAACLLAISLLAGCVEQGESKTLKVFHAGSLAVPLGEAEREFEQLYPEIDVQRESYGSVEAIRQITEAG